MGAQSNDFPRMRSVFSRHKTSFGITLAVCSVAIFFTFSSRLKVNGSPVQMNIPVQPAGTTTQGDQASQTKLGAQPQPKTEPLKPKTELQGQLWTLRTKGIDHGLANYNIDTMDEEQRRLTLHTVLDNTDTICRRKLRMGKLGDGGWEICDDEDVRPPHECLVYSFGINNDFSFDDDTANVYGCQVISIDPSMRSNSYKRSERVYFHKVGIGGSTRKQKNGWQIYTLTDLKKYLKQEDRRIDVLKMDVEKAEWEALPEMVASGALKGVKQLLLEYHVEPTVDITMALRVVQSVEKLGFKKFYVHKNVHCGIAIKSFPVIRTQCYEIHYVYRP